MPSIARCKGSGCIIIAIWHCIAPEPCINTRLCSLHRPATCVLRHDVQFIGLGLLLWLHVLLPGTFATTHYYEYGLSNAFYSLSIHTNSNKYVCTFTCEIKAHGAFRVERTTRRNTIPFARSGELVENYVTF